MRTSLPGTGEPRTCYKCDYETSQPQTDCPHCGQRLRTARQVRVLGWVLLLTGTFLVGFMGTITVLVARIVAHSDEPGATTRFTGGTGIAVFMFGIFGLVLAFGLTSMFGGIWQIRYGKRNRKLTLVILVLAAGFLVLGTLVQLLE